jgi:hypothetical protein
MTNIEDKRSDFAAKLGQLHAQHKEKQAETLADMRTWLIGEAVPRRQDPAARMAELDERLKSKTVPAAEVDFSGDGRLRDLDRHFVRLFHIERYFSTEPLNYPTVYCETLEEFFAPILAAEALSAEAKAVQLKDMIADAQEMAKRYNGGGVLGFNLPGTGCYLNGWLLAYGRDISPRLALEDPKLLRRILSVAAHEKLGHGFLAAYTSLGQTKEALGRSLNEVAERFGIAPAQSAASRLRRDQAGLLGFVSQLQEEGWATWLETYLSRAVLGFGSHPRHSLSALSKAIEHLPVKLQNRKEVQEYFYAALEVLFGEETYPDQVILEAVKAIQVLGSQLDDHFSQELGQPLRYALGELLFMLAEANQGEVCAPYTAVIAGSVDPDPEQVSLADLRELVSRDARLNPDARLAMLCRLQLQQENNVNELARQAESTWSLQLPVALKNK